MGLLSRIEASGDARLSRDVDPWSGAHWNSYAGIPSAAGVTVSANSVQTLSAVWAAVLILGSDIAGLGCHLLRRLHPRGKERADDHPLYSLLAYQPNAIQTAFELWEMLVGHLILRGNFYAQIFYDDAGEVEALVPLHPDRMRVELLPSGRIRYVHRLPNGGTEYLPQIGVWHVRARTEDGLHGLSLVQFGARSLGRAIAAEEYASRFYTHGAAPSFAAVHPGALGPEGLKNLRESINAYTAGARNAHGVLTLEEGIAIHKLGISPEDAQLIESSKFGIAEVARWTRIPLHKLAEGEKAAAYASVEANNQDYATSALAGLCVRIEHTIRRDLIIDQAQYFAKFNLGSFMRGDSAARGAFHTQMYALGAASTNDILELEDRNPIGPEGDQRFRSANLIPLDAPVGVVVPRDTSAPGRPPVGIVGVIEEAAARVVRKEIAAIGKEAPRFAADAVGFDGFVRAFYVDHVALVAGSLRLSVAAASAWCEARAEAVLEPGGLREFEAGERAAVARLVGVVMTEAGVPAWGAQ